YKQNINPKGLSTPQRPARVRRPLIVPGHPSVMPKIVDHQQRRDILAEVAAITIANIGLENTTIREIARQSGYSKGIIEHYFDSKEDLIASALAWLNRRYQLRVAKEIGQHQGLAAIRIRLEQTLPLCEQSIQEWKVRLRFWSLAAIDARFQEVQ